MKPRETAEFPNREKLARRVAKLEERLGALMALIKGVCHASFSTILEFLRDCSHRFAAPRGLFVCPVNA